MCSPGAIATVIAMNPSSHVITTPPVLTAACGTRWLGAIVGALILAALVIVLALSVTASAGGPTGSTGRSTPSPSPQRSPDACQATHRCP